MLRFWNNDFTENRDGVLEAILSVAHSRSGSKKTLTHPSPVKAGEG